MNRLEPEAAVFWLSGLPAAGKSTLARAIFEELRARELPAEWLDGDRVREVFPETGFSSIERDIHIRRVGYAAHLLEKHGVFVVSSFISPFSESRAFVRGLCRNFVEIHVATSLEICESRDPGGLYARARRGELQQVTGIDSLYEPPEKPEIRIDTGRLSLKAAEKEIQARIAAFLPVRPS